MKRFILKAAIFFLLFKIIDFSFSSFFLWSRLPNLSLEADYGSLNRMYQGLINADVVAFGSSRTYLHINPEVIQNITGMTAWNLGMDGTNFDQHFFTLEEYLLHNKTPQVVIFEAELASLDPEILRFKTELFLPHRNDSVHTMELFYSGWEERFGYWFFSSSVYKPEIPQVFNNFGGIFDRMKKGNGSYSPVSDGVMKLDMGDYILVNGAQIKKGQVPDNLPVSLPFDSPQRSFDLSNMAKRKQAFEDLSRLAEDKGFVLILLMSPYLAGEVNESQLGTARNFFVTLADKYPNTYFLDFSTADPFAHDTMLWWNAGHLNFQGANLLSEKISLEITRIIKDKK